MSGMLGHYSATYAYITPAVVNLTHIKSRSGFIAGAGSFCLNFFRTVLFSSQLKTLQGKNCMIKKNYKKSEGST